MNVFLKPFHKNLQLQIAQTIFADNRAHHIGKLNFDNEVSSMDFGLINTCKNFSLPVSILNQDFKVLRRSEEFQSVSQLYSEIDVLISCFNLSTLAYEERYDFIKEMQKQAPKALFIEYENPERNAAYPMFYSFIAGEYLPMSKKNAKTPDNHIKHLKEYLKEGALEGFIYDIPKQTGINPKKIKRDHLYVGAIGLYYCEW